MANYKQLALSLAVLVMIPSLSMAGSAFAYQGVADYTHAHATALTNPGLVCGGHICAPGESSGNPSPVAPIRGN